jgi:hypothetical protein
MATIDFWGLIVTAVKSQPGQAATVFEVEKEALEAANAEFKKFAAELENSPERQKLKKAVEGAAELEVQLLECEEQIKHLDRERDEADDLKSASTLVRKIVEARMRREELQAWFIKVKADNAAEGKRVEEIERLAKEAKIHELRAANENRRKELESAITAVLGEKAIELAGVVAVGQFLTTGKVPEPPAPEPAPEPAPAPVEKQYDPYPQWSEPRTPRGVAVPGMKSEGRLRALGSYP